jgi:hypothetical protein
MVKKCGHSSRANNTRTLISHISLLAPLFRPLQHLNPYRFL